VHDPLTSSEVARYYAARFPDLKQRGPEWRYACPLHNGKGPNFSVKAETGEWYCHSQCNHGGSVYDLEMEISGAAFREARDAVFGIVGRPLPVKVSRSTPAKPSGRWQELARYPYVNAEGVLLFEVIRYLKPDGKKTFVQCRPSGVEEAGTSDPGFVDGVPTGGIVLGLDAGMYLPDNQKSSRAGKRVYVPAQHSLDGYHFEFRECPRVPYRLPKVLAAEIVFLPEGEKDVHTLERWNLVGSCNPGGAGGGWRPEYTPHFLGRHCIILPDNDKPGRRHAYGVAQALLPVAASVRVVELPVPEKGDITDWVESGGTQEQIFRARAQCRAAHS
jgi:hypothetical protein